MNMEPFFLCENDSDNLKSKERLFLEARKQRTLVQVVRGLKKIYRFGVGDVIVVVFWKHDAVYRFEGICLAIRKKGLLHQNTGIVLRNVILKVVIEVFVSYFCNRIFFLEFSDYKRKHFYYRKSKLFYIRKRLNQASKV